MGYPKHCWSVAKTAAFITHILNHEGVKVERFKVETVTSNGSKMVLVWDRREVNIAGAVDQAVKMVKESRARMNKTKKKRQNLSTSTRKPGAPILCRFGS